jgi:Flp pilus assembly protein TadB
MELEEVQHIWNAQNKQMPYSIDTDELHRRILARKARAVHITNFTERLNIVVGLSAGAFTLWTNATSRQHSFFIYCYSVWMFFVVILLVFARVRRKAAGRRFERSVQGELQHGLAVADYQVKFSQLMRWNIFVVGGLILFGLWETAKPWWAMAGIIVVLSMGWYVSGFENRYYRRQKKRLEELRDVLNA